MNVLLLQWKGNNSGEKGIIRVSRVLLVHQERVAVCSGWIGRAQVLRAGDWEFGSWSSQINDLCNWYLSLPSLALSINRIGQGLVSSVQDNVTEWDINSWCVWPGFTVCVAPLWHYSECALSQVGIYHDMNLDVANNQTIRKETEAESQHVRFAATSYKPEAWGGGEYT